MIAAGKPLTAEEVAALRAEVPLWELRGGTVRIDPALVVRLCDSVAKCEAEIARLRALIDADAAPGEVTL